MSFYLLFYNQGFLKRLLSRQRALERLRRVLSSIRMSQIISLIFTRNRLFRTVTTEEGAEVLLSINTLCSLLSTNVHFLPHSKRKESVTLVVTANQIKCSVLLRHVTI